MDRRAYIFTAIVSRTSLDGECWIWRGPTSGTKGRGHGYPRMSLDGQTVAVHRVMWVNRHGYLPGRKQIDHTCRNRLCVNPDHLEMVTHLTNQRRRDAANKGPRGAVCVPSLSAPAGNVNTSQENDDANQSA